MPSPSKKPITTKPAVVSPPPRNRSFFSWIEENIQRHGNIFCIAGIRPTFVVSGSTGRSLYAQHQYVRRVSTPFFDGPDGVLTIGSSSFNDQNRRKKALLRAFSIEGLQSWLPVIEKTICDVMKQWKNRQLVEFNKSCRELAWDLCCLTLVGNVYPQGLIHIERIAAAIVGVGSVDADEDKQKLLLWIETQLNNGSDSYATRLLSDDQLTQAEVIHEIFRGLFAGAGLWMPLAGFLNELETNPTLQHECAKEIASAELTVNNALPQKNSTLDGVLLEVRRLYPAVTVLNGQAMHCIEHEGIVIPEGARILISLWSEGRDPRRFTEFLQIKPERWTNGKDETWVPHGFGDSGVVNSRRCPAEDFVGILLKSFSIVALKELSWSMQDTETASPTLGGTFRPLGYTAQVSCRKNKRAFQKRLSNSRPQKNTRIPTISPDARVAVVGAGIGGLMMARALQKRGCKVVVFEAAGRIAAKCDTVEIDGFEYNLGAHLIYSNGSVMHLAKELGVEIEPSVGSQWFDLDKGIVPQHTALYEQLHTYQHVIEELPGLKSPGFVGCQDLSASIPTWVKAHDLMPLAESFQTFYTGAGYGFSTNSFSAAYFLRFVKEIGLGQKNGGTPKGGFRRLLAKLAETLDVRLMSPVTAVDREKRVLRTPQGEHSFDELVITCIGAEKFLDTSPKENQLLNKIQTLPYTTVVLLASNLPKDKDIFLVRDAKPGHVSAFSFYNPASDVCLAWGYATMDQTDDEFAAAVSDDLTRAGGQVGEILFIRRWDYFPHVTPTDFALGFYDALDARQGLNHTWYGGGLLSFELTDCVVEWTQQFVATRMMPEANSQPVLTQMTPAETLNASPRFSTVVDAFHHHLAQTPEQALYTCLEESVRTWTYQELAALAYGVAKSLQQSGIQVGDRIALVYPPGSHHFPAALWGCLLAGVVAVPMAPPKPLSTSEDLERFKLIVEDAGCNVALTSTQYYRWAQMGKWVQPISHLFKKKRAKASPQWPELRWLTTDSTEPATLSSLQPVKIHPEMLAYLQYTSGSTGNPKGVVVYHKTLAHNLELISSDSVTNEKSIMISWVPWFHDMGLVAGFLNAAYTGAQLVFYSGLTFIKEPLSWLKAIHDYKATAISAPNFAYELVVRRLTVQQTRYLDLSSLRLAIFGGEVTNTETMRKFAARFADNGFNAIAFRNVYGLAEAVLYLTGANTSPKLTAFNAAALEQRKVVQVAPGSSDSRELVSAGVPQASHGVSLLIVDESTHSLRASNQVGEIWASSPSIGPGYYDAETNNEQMFRASLVEGGQTTFLRTGDLGFFHKGHLYICGRSKELIIVAGRNIYPYDLEELTYNSDPLLRSGCVAAFGVEMQGSECVVIVAEVRDASADRKNLATKIVPRIRDLIYRTHGVACHAVVLIPPRKLPKTTSGKIRRQAVKQAFLRGELPVVYASQENIANPPDLNNVDNLHHDNNSHCPRQLEDIQQWIVEQLSQRLHIESSEIDLDMPLENWGIDSVAVVGFAERMSKWLGFQVEMRDFFEYRTINKLSQRLSALSSMAMENDFGEDELSERNPSQPKTSHTALSHPMMLATPSSNPILDTSRSERDINRNTQEAIARKIHQILQDYLVVAVDLNADTNLFQIGSDSLLAIHLIKKLNTHFNVSLSLQDLSCYPTIKQLAEFIERHQVERIQISVNSSNPITLIRLNNDQNITKTPLFLMHPAGGGTVYFYRDLALQLNRPVYGINPFAHNDQSNNTALSIEQMAMDYIPMIKTVQPHGPYYLGGMSMGGNIAYEMAQQLHNMGESIGFLTMMDSFYDNTFLENVNFDMFLLQTIQNRSLRPVQISIDKFQTMNKEEKNQFFLHHLDIGEDISSDEARRIVTGILNMYKKHATALKNYRAPFCQHKTPIIYYYASENIEGLFPKNPEKEWKSLLGEQFIMHAMPGNHYTMSNAKHAKQGLAQSLCDYLQEADDNYFLLSEASCNLSIKKKSYNVVSFFRRLYKGDTEVEQAERRPPIVSGLDNVGLATLPLEKKANFWQEKIYQHTSGEEYCDIALSNLQNRLF